MKFEHTFYHYDHFTGAKGGVKETIVMEFEDDNLQDVLETFTRFLHACGYQTEGNLDFIKDE